MKPPLDIVVVGGLNTDFLIRGPSLPEPGETIQGGEFLSAPGGKGANQAVVTARLGSRTAMIGKVGREPRGTDLIKALQKERVNTRWIFRDAKTPTGAALIMVDQSGEKQILASPGANEKLTQTELHKAASILKQCRVLMLQFEVPMPVVVEAARLARRGRARVVLDPAPAHPMPKELFELVDFIRPNASEAEALTGCKVTDRASARKAAHQLLKRGIGAVGIQAGEAGDLLVTPDEEHWLPRVKVQTVDATGAGDAFVAAMAVALSEGKSWLEAGRLANATAALATTKFGAQAGLPTRAEAERLLCKVR
ncbi:MAG: ribokinase [Verrucomicrobiota bacterium]